MPYTAVLFSYRKPGTSPEAFKKHYETVHIPTLQEVSGPLFPQKWIRHYIQRSSAEEDSTRPATIRFGDQAYFDYDAYAEVVFEDKVAFEKFFACLHEAKNLGKLKSQEEMFVIRERFRMTIVDETNVTENKGKIEKTDGRCDDMSISSKSEEEGIRHIRIGVQ